MPSSIRIPRTIGAAERKLTELGELATATEWQRAAIVATYVDTPGSGNVSSDILESAQSFASRGIVGLRSHNTVLAYARAWLDNYERPRPGHSVTLPDDDWPPTRTGTDGYETEAGVERTIERIIERHGVEAVVSTATRHDPEAATTAVARVRRENLPPVPFPTPPDAYPGAGRDDARMDISRDIGHLGEAIGRFETWLRNEPVLIADHADRLQQESERLALVASAARGMTDDDISAVLGEDAQ